MSERVTLKGEVVKAIVEANPAGRLKAVEFGIYGELRRVEWHDDAKETERHQLAEHRAEVAP
jgi:hypothetical protein